MLHSLQASLGSMRVAFPQYMFLSAVYSLVVKWVAYVVMHL